MDLDVLLLSRVQFAFVMAFHILFPAFTIGLAAFIALLEGLWWATGRAAYVRLSNLWIKIFAVSFGMGVVSGVVMSYQFGTNWSRFADATGNVLGPLFGYEVLTAFFLEATFLGILLFGRKLVPRPVFFLAAVAVALGTVTSAFWILAANSWMHTPAGFELRDGIFHLTDWRQALFNPSFPYRFAHMVTACFLTTGFVVIGAAAWNLLGGRAPEESRVALKMTIALVALLAPLQVALGDLHGLNTLTHQPLKVAAMEGHWESQRGAPAILFAIPDEEAETNRHVVGIPRLASLILTHDPWGRVPGVKEWPKDERPPVAVVFWSFRVMVVVGLVMVAMAVTGAALALGGRLSAARWYLRLCTATTPIGFVAILAGWVTTEVGRQPWIVHGLMRTAEGVSRNLTPGTVAGSLAAYVLAYAVIFPAGVLYMARLARQGGED